MKKFLCILIPLLFAVFLSAQEWGTGRWGMSAGRTSGIPEGDTIWTCAFGTDSAEDGNCVIETADGNYLIGSWTRKRGGASNFLLLVSSDGESLDASIIGGTPNGNGGIISVIPVYDGYVFAASGFSSTHNCYEAGKVDLNLDSVWNKVYTYSGDTTDIVRGINHAYPVPEDNLTEGYVLTGYSKGRGPGTPSKENIWLLFLDSVGDTLWSKVFGGSGYEFCNLPYPTIQVGPPYGYLTVGDNKESTQEQARCIFMDVKGDSIYGKDFGVGSSGKHESFYSVIQTADGNYAMCGYCSGIAGQPAGKNIYFAKMSANATHDSILTRAYGGSQDDLGWSLVETPDHNFLITGYTKSFGDTDGDVFLLKVNSDGDSLWMKTWGGPAMDFGHQIIKTSTNDYLIIASTLNYGVNSGVLNCWLLKIKGAEL